MQHTFAFGGTSVGQAETAANDVKNAGRVNQFIVRHASYSTFARALSRW
jgi:hypothetical protein